MERSGWRSNITKSIPVENLKSYFAIPLRPDAYSSQVARHLRINFELHSAHATSNFQAAAKTFPLQLDENTPHSVKGHFEGENVNLSEDFVATYDLDAAGADTLQVLTYRNPVSGQPSPTETAPVRSTNEPGFFEAEALFGYGKSSAFRSKWKRRFWYAENAGHPLRYVALDAVGKAGAQLSGSGELCCARCGRPTGSICCCSTTRSRRFSPLPWRRNPPRPARPRFRPLEQAARRHRSAASACRPDCSSVRRPAGANPYLILLSDGGATRGPIQNGKLASWYAESWKQLPETQRPRTYIFAVGDDANLPLLQRAGPSGWFAGTCALDRTRRIQAEFVPLQDRPQPHRPIESGGGPGVGGGHGLSAAGFYLLRFARVLGGALSGRERKCHVYGSRCARRCSRWRCRPRPTCRAKLSTIRSFRGCGPEPGSMPCWKRSSAKAKTRPPSTKSFAWLGSTNSSRPTRRFWRCHARCCGRASFVPGDPVLRVKTDESISSVTALFPFGLVQQLRYLSGEDVWQTRFLAPDDMQDGTYTVRLVLRDRVGHTYREFKTFVIASKPPVVQVKLDTKRYHRGQTIDLKASASQSTRTLVARLEGVAAGGAELGCARRHQHRQLVIPEQTVPGTYKLTVTAEDIAHNIGTQEVQIEVLP